MAQPGNSVVYDHVIIGSGFGGSISAMRLTEKGYKVLVLERGKRFRDQDFAKRTWDVFKYMWAPILRCFGILQISPFKDVFVMHGSGVGGGSLGYANVLMRPSDKLFENPSWKHLADWKKVLEPHFETAEYLLGVVPNPCFWPADNILRGIAAEIGTGQSFQATTVGAFFGEPGKEGVEIPDPYFRGEGPTRAGCIQCGACMVGCRYNAKNTLVKNYLYFAEKWGAEVWPESEVSDVRPLLDSQPDGACYEVIYRSTTARIYKPEKRVRARNVIFAAGSLGTLRLLFRCRELTKSLPRLSRCLGNMVRTNSENLLGVTSRDLKDDFSRGIAITSIFQADDVTTIEPVRYPAGSSVIRLLAGPVVDPTGSLFRRLVRTIGFVFKTPRDFAKMFFLPGWARRTTIMLIMQTEDNRIYMRLGRSIFTGFRKTLVSQTDQDHKIPARIEVGHQVTHKYASRVNGFIGGMFNETLLNIPTTAHILGGCPIGISDQDGVVGLDCQIHNYPGLYVVDGSIMPGNPGTNPSLTIAALAEYAMSCVSPKEGVNIRQPLGAPPNGNDLLSFHNK